MLKRVMLLFLFVCTFSVQIKSMEAFNGTKQCPVEAESISQIAYVAAVVAMSAVDYLFMCKFHREGCWRKKS